MNNFSGALRLTDLNDFIGPSQACIKPVPIKKTNKRGVIKLDDDGNWTQNSIPLPKQTITLTDCLACSGCVTSAETVLIESQSSDALQKAREDKANNHVFVATVCPQSISSIAHKAGLDFTTAAQGLISALRQDGYKYIFSSVEGSEISHQLSALELLSSSTYHNYSSAYLPVVKLPILGSACPGWICYAEKTQPERVLRHLSRVRSPQSIMGRLVKERVAAWEAVDRARVYHVSIMPCYDKKLEASRAEFTSEGVPETDLVLSTLEAQELWGEAVAAVNNNLDSGPSEILFNSVFNDTFPIKTLSGGGSGGFAERTLGHVARLLGHPEPLQITFTPLRNRDIQEARVEIQGRVYKVARAYGFRNIQYVVGKVRRFRPAEYDYIEVMACPGGCLNGGGQIRLGNPDEVENVGEIYSSVVQTELEKGLEGLIRDAGQFITSYKAVEKTTSALSTQW